MSKSLIRLVDEAILPAFLIVGIKVIAITVITNLFSLSVYYENFGKLYYQNRIDVVSVNTWSDIAVFTFFLGVISVLLVRLLFFSDNKTKPSILLKLVKANRLDFIQTSVELYHIIVVWMVFFTGIVVFIAVRALQGIDYAIVCIPVLVAYLTVFWIIIKEIEKDIVRRIHLGKDILT